MTTYTKLLCLLLCVAAGAWGVRTTPPRDKKDIHCYLLVMKFPIYDTMGNKLPNDFFEGTNRVFVYHDLAMYENKYGFDSGIVENSPPKFPETRYRYFVFCKDSSSGAEYDPHYPDSVAHREVAYARRLLGGFLDTTGKAKMFLHGDFPLIYAHAARGSLTEAYKILDPKHPKDGDTLWLGYSDGFGALPASLFYIHDTDSLPQMRLAEVRMQVHFHDVPSPTGEQYGPPDHGKVIWKVEETPFFNRDSAAIYFTKYQNYLDSSRR